jgi:rhodanese-related sulfurtransferase
MGELFIQFIVGLGFLLLAFLVTCRAQYYWRTLNVRRVSLADVAKVCGDGTTVILDVRTPKEYAEGHIQGAVLLPLYELAERMSEVPRDRPVYVICYSGERSLQAVKFLMSQGYRQVFQVSQGMEKWQGTVLSNIVAK